MAEESNGGLVFGIRLDNSMLQKDIENAQRMFDSLSKNAGNGKGNIDLGSMFSGTGDAAEKVSSKYSKSLQDLYIAAGNAGNKVREESAQTVSSVSDDLNKLNSGFNSITSLAGKMFMGVSAMEIAGKMFDTRSYFQDAESSMKVFLGSAEKGTKFINELKDYAYYNMFEFSDLVGASKQLIAYGTEAEKVTDVLDKLSNIATGTGANLNDMVGMYNKAKSVGKVDSQGLESWAARGVLVKDTLREMGEVVGSTGVTFEQLNKVLAKVTGEGGMFHDLMLEQMDNLSASMGQLQDNLTSMWNEIGEASEGAMKGAIDLAGLLVENYQEIGSVLLDVAKVYGAYKLVDMSDIKGIIERTQAEIAEAEAQTQLTETFKQHSEEIKNMMSADQAYEVARSGLQEGTLEYAQAVRSMIDADKESTAAKLEAIELEEKGETARRDSLTLERRAIEQQIYAEQQSGNARAVVALETQKETVQEKINASQKRLSEIATQKKAAADKAAAAASRSAQLATMQSTTAVNADTKAKQRNTVITRLWAKAQGTVGKAAQSLNKMLNETLLSNPYALAIAGAVALADAIYDICTAQNALDKANEIVSEGLQQGFDNAMKEIEKSVDKDFNAIRNLQEGSDEYKKALADLIKKYPELEEVIGSNARMTDVLTLGYDTVTEAIIRKNRAAQAENIQTNLNNELTEKQKKTLELFEEQLEDMDLSSLDFNNLSTKFQIALKKGLSYDELEDDIKKVFEESSSNWQKVLSVSTGGVTDLFNVGNFTNQEGWAASMKAKIKGLFTGDFEGYEEYDSKLRSVFLHTNNFADACDKAKEKLADLSDENAKAAEAAAKNKKAMDDYFSQNILEQFNKDVTAAKDNLQGLIDRMEWDFRNGSKENKAAFKKQVEEAQNAYVEAQRKLKMATKEIMGDDLNAREQKYKRSIDQYKSFASEYAKLEIKRQNDLDKLEQSRDKKGANQGVIDVQVADVNKKADDDLKLLMAKYYNVSGKTAEEVKNVFENALTLPVDEAQNRLLEVTTRIEKIKNAAANGENIATREEQAKLAAEQAALQQNIAKSQEKGKYDEKEKAYEDYYNNLIQIATEKEGKIAELERKKTLGEINEEQYKQSLQNLNTFYDAQANIMRKKSGITDEETIEQSLDIISSTTNQSINAVMANIEKLEQEIECYKEQLTNGYDTSDELNTALENYDKALKEIQLDTSSSIDGISGLYSQIQRAEEELKALEVEKAQGKDVAKDIAQKRAQISVLTTLYNKVGEAQEETSAKTAKLTKDEQRLLDAMTNQAKWKKVTKYYDAARSGLSSVIDGCDGLSDSTKDVINGMMEMGDALMSIVDQLMQNAVSSAMAMQTAGTASAEAVKTAEKGSVILAVIGAAIQAVMAIVKIFNKHGKTARAQANIEAIEGQVKELDRAYDKLGKEIDDAYSTDATPLIIQQDKLLAQKEALVKQQIAEEKSKRKKKQDADQIKEWEQELKDIAEARGNIEQNWVEKLIGKDYKGVLEDFSGSVMDAMDDAETSVEDAVKNIGKSIKKGAIQQQLNAKLQPTTEEYAKTLSKAMEDGVLNASETSVLEGLEKNIATISENYLGQFNDLWAQAEEESRNAVTGGITNMSQDTAEEMNGRLTQIQSHTFSISENVAQMRAFAQQQLSQLAAINANTLAALGKQDRIAAILDDITIRGVKLKS